MDVLQSDFDELNALTRVFQSAGCDAMSPSTTLVFLVPSGSFQPFKAVDQKLPIWKCNSFTIVFNRSRWKVYD